MDDVTHELTLQDVENDPNWITKSSSIVTSNVDRAIINAEAAKAFGKCNNVPILRWKRKLSPDCENILHGYLYGGDLLFVILKGIYGFKFAKRFLEISSRDLTPPSSFLLWLII